MTASISLHAELACVVWAVIVVACCSVLKTINSHALQQTPRPIMVYEVQVIRPWKQIRLWSKLSIALIITNIPFSSLFWMLFKMVRVCVWLSWISSRHCSASCIILHCLSKLWIMSTMDELITLMWLWKQCLQDAAEQAWFMTCLLRFLANTNSGRCVGKDLVDLLIADWLSPTH